MHIMDGRSREHAVWTRVGIGAGRPLDLMTARFSEHRYAPHCHEEYAVGVCTDGLETIRYRGERHLAGPGSIVVLAPGEMHTGGPAAEEGFAYRVLYPAPPLLGEGVVDRPHFREPVIEDPELAAAIGRVPAGISRSRDPIEAESRLPWLLTALARRHAQARPVPDATPGAARVARTVRTRLADELLAPPSLTEIA